MITHYQEMFNKAADDLKGRFVPGAIENSLKANSNLGVMLSIAEKELDRAWRQDDMQVFRQALTGWYLLSRTILGQYAKEATND